MQPSETISQWSESAPYWEKHRAIISEMFAPVTQALIQDAEVSSGQTVLDVATGPGEPALSIAGLVGAGGKVVGTDVVPEMLEAASRESSRRKVENARFILASTDSLPFSDGSFDVVVSRFGVMFFPSPVNCIREMLRVMKPDARLALAVWHWAKNNPFHYVVSQVLERYVEAAPPDPGAPDAFRFAKPGELLTVLSKAGAAETSERLLRFSIQARMSVEDFWTLRSEMSDKLRTKLAVLSKPQLTKLRSEVIEAAGAYSSEGGIAFPGEVLIVSGCKRA